MKWRESDTAPFTTTWFRQWSAADLEDAAAPWNLSCLLVSGGCGAGHSGRLAVGVRLVVHCD